MKIVAALKTELADDPEELRRQEAQERDGLRRFCEEAVRKELNTFGERMIKDIVEKQLDEVEEE